MSYVDGADPLVGPMCIKVIDRLEGDENIPIKDCAWCGQPFYQGRDNHRFCCVEHGRQFHIAERRAALALYRAIQVQRTGVFGTTVEEQEDGPENSRLAG